MVEVGNEKAAIVPPSVVAWLLGPNGDGIIQDIDTTIERIRQFRPGTKVKISGGAFDAHIGRVGGQLGKRVHVLLSVLGSEREVEVREGQLTEVAAS